MKSRRFVAAMAVGALVLAASCGDSSDDGSVVTTTVATTEDSRTVPEDLVAKPPVDLDALKAAVEAFDAVGVFDQVIDCVTEAVASGEMTVGETIDADAFNSLSDRGKAELLVAAAINECNVLEIDPSFGSGG